MAKTLGAWTEEIIEWRKGKGFHTPESYDEPDAIMTKLFLVMSECAEAGEAIRAKDPDLDNFREEIADTVIRLLDLAGTLGFDLETEIEKKMAANRLRPHMHGKRA